MRQRRRRRTMGMVIITPYIRDEDTEEPSDTTEERGYPEAFDDLRLRTRSPLVLLRQTKRHRRKRR